VLRIPGEKDLCAFEEVGEQQRYEAEDQHCDRVLLPAHFLIRVDPAHPIDDAFDRPEQGIEKGLLPFQHAGDIETERPHQEQQHGQKHHKLQPAIRDHFKISPDTTA
jgi:hypothetical protein